MYLGPLTDKLLPPSSRLSTYFHPAVVSPPCPRPHLPLPVLEVGCFPRPVGSMSKTRMVNEKTLCSRAPTHQRAPPLRPQLNRLNILPRCESSSVTSGTFSACFSNPCSQTAKPPPSTMISRFSPPPRSLATIITPRIVDHPFWNLIPVSPPPCLTNDPGSSLELFPRTTVSLPSGRFGAGGAYGNPW
jgi:hypothetical protein